MKNYKIFALPVLVLLLSVLACKTTDNETTFKFNESFELKFEKEKISEDGAVSLTLTQVTDSRCPEGTYCIWEGEAAVKFSLDISGGDAQELELITKSTQHPDSDRDTLGNYIFILENVLPYPTASGVDQEDYYVQMRVENL